MVSNLAAKAGNVEVLKWLHRHKAPMDNMVCEYAALHGQLDVLKWAHEVGLEWNAVSFANMRGRAGIVAWAREHGCRCVAL